MKERIRRRVKQTKDYSQEVLGRTAKINRFPKKLEETVKKRIIKLDNDRFYWRVNQAKSHYLDANDKERHEWQQHLIHNINYNRKIIAFDFGTNSRTFNYLNKIYQLQKRVSSAKKQLLDAENHLLTGDHPEREEHRNLEKGDHFGEKGGRGEDRLGDGTQNKGSDQESDSETVKRFEPVRPVKKEIPRDFFRQTVRMMTKTLIFRDSCKILTEYEAKAPNFDGPFGSIIQIF